MVSLVRREDGLVAYPTGKGSGSITAFAQADGFLTVPALADSLAAGTEAGHAPHAASAAARPRHHGQPLYRPRRRRRPARGTRSRRAAPRRRQPGGLAAARRGECDIAPIHLLDPKTGAYNAPFLSPGSPSCRAGGGCRASSSARATRVSRAGPRRRRCGGARRSRLPDGQPQPRRRHAHPDRPAPGGRRPEGYWNQPNSHNAVAAAVAQERGDWGLAIEPAAQAYGLGFLPLSEEHYDFALVDERRERPAVAAFLDARRGGGA